MAVDSFRSGRRTDQSGSPLLNNRPDDGATLEELFRSERPRLRRALRRRIADPDDAADLVQDAFLRLATARPTGGLRAPRAYLARVIRNLIADRAKSAEQRLVIKDDGDAAAALTTPPQQQWGLEAEDLMRNYKAAVATLPPRTREVFLLHRVEELRYRDIAERLGVSVATVEYHIARALAALDRALER